MTDNPNHPEYTRAYLSSFTDSDLVRELYRRLVPGAQIDQISTPPVTLSLADQLAVSRYEFANESAVSQLVASGFTDPTDTDLDGREITFAQALLEMAAYITGTAPEMSSTTYVKIYT